MNPLVGIAGVLAALAGMFAVLKLVEHLLHPPAELTRKLAHVGTGAVALTFPWLFHARWPVVLLSAIAAGALLAVRLVPRLRGGVGSVLLGVRRPSLGELYFPLAVCVVFWLSDRDRILYCVPLLIMTLADTTAALIGIAYGKVRYVTSEGLKSAEGSIAFFAIAFLSVHVPLLLHTDVGRPETLLIATIIGVLSMLLEAIAWRGLDNLLIPIGAFAFLKLYLTKSVDELELRLVATLLLLAFAFAWRRRSSLDDSALMCGALFAYGALMLGGPTWLIGPVALFVMLGLAWPRAGVVRDHSVFAVLSVIGAALLWLGFHVRDATRADFFFAYAATFGVHLAVVGVSRIGLGWPADRQATHLLAWVGVGSALTLAQWVSFTAAAPSLIASAASFVGVAMGTLAFFAAKPLVYGPRGSDGAIHGAGFVSAILGSSATLLMHPV